MSEPEQLCGGGGEHFMCGCITHHAREIMRHWTGSNCTFADDDITALGILAGHAIRAGLHRDAAIPQTLVAAIDAHCDSGSGRNGGDALAAPGEAPQSGLSESEGIAQPTGKAL